MTRPVKVMAAGDPVEAAYLAGKFPAERRSYWRKQMAAKPRATMRALARMEAVLPPPDGDEAVDMAGYEAYANAAPVAPGSSGPTEYPQEWVAQPQRPGPITFEDSKIAAQTGMWS